MKRALLILTIFLSMGHAHAQEYFERIYENPFLQDGSARALSVNVINDTTYMHGMGLDYDNRTIGFLISLNSDGDTIAWKKYRNDAYQINLPINEKVVYRDDSFYMTYSEFHPSNNIDKADSLVKTQMNGEILWKRSLRIDPLPYKRQHYRGLIDYHNQGFLCFGTIADTVGTLLFSQVKGLVTRTDTAGNILWHQRYDQVLSIEHLELTADGGVLISGYQNLAQPGGSGGDIILLRTDSLGNELWRYVMEHWEDGVQDHETFAPITYLNDSVFVVITENEGLEGYFNYSGPLWLKKIWDRGAQGYTTLDEEYLDEKNTEKSPREMILTQSGNLAMTGYNGQFVTDPEGVPRLHYSMGYLLMVSPDLDSLWSRYYSHFDQFEFEPIDPRMQLYDISELPDGGFVMCGSAQRSYSDPMGAITYPWLIRTDSLGCIEPGCHLISGLTEQVMGLQGSMTAYPNPLPAGSALQLAFSPQPSGTMPYAQEATQVQVYDLQGRLVHVEPIPAQGSNVAFSLSLDLPQLSRGSYTAHWMSMAGAWYDGVTVIVE